MEIWIRARETSDFALFQPALAKMFDLNRELAEWLGYKESPYDALIDQYEPEMRVSELAPVFSTLKTELIALVRAISPRIGTVDDSFLRAHYPESKQWNFGLDVLRRLGFDFDCGRQDKSVHPFTTSFSIRDVRITTRIDENFLPTALFGTLHEAGHALYEQGVSSDLERTPLAGGTSLGIHESQSRLWENLVGRSRAFWQFFFPTLQQWFRDNLNSTSLETFYRGINRVEPSLIRVEADEVTYNLHILIRFELELDLLEKRLDVKDLPEAWNSKMKEYLDVVPSNHSEGVLQDVHWSNGLIGYFPTYSLGNLISVQLYQEAIRQNSSIVDEIAQGHFETLLRWLREHVHCSGRKFLPSELLLQATGRGLQAEPYLAYLKEKYSAIYSF